MTYISPLLQNRLNNNSVSQNPNNRRDAVYENLQKKANEAKPNEAKAYLVEEGMLGNPITAIKDTIQDGKNFFKAVKTGKMGDNSLGRINDLGLGIGAALIASYLATNKAKTKTDAIMKFVGGGAFLASMSLWPKLFINIPARLVHGFRIDRKYISAQGDKKDFFLDNQFLVWDAYPEEQLRKDAKRAGIDYDSKNGKEKIQRKMQKTALQNRTLWMATAGFATPLLTSMFCSTVEPHIENAVISRGVKKTQKILNEGVGKYLSNVKPDVRNAKEIDALIGSYKDKALDKNFFDSLADLMKIDDVISKYTVIDDAFLATKLSSYGVSEQLQELYKSTLVASKESLQEALGNIKIPSFETKLEEVVEDVVKEVPKQTGGLFAQIASFGGEKPTEQIIEQIRTTKEVQVLTFKNVNVEDIIESLKGKYDYTSVRTALEAQGVPQAQIETCLKELKPANTNEFLEFVKQYNEGPLAQMRGRIKAYVDLANPVVGSRAEAASTREIKKATQKVLKKFDLSYEEMMTFRKASTKYVTEVLSGKIIEKLEGVKFGSDEYKELIRSLMTDGFDEETAKAIENLGNIENISEISAGDTLGKFNIKALNDAILGGESPVHGTNSAFNTLKELIRNKGIDVDAIRSKAVIAANFEARLKNGEFKDVLSDEDLKIAKHFIYDGPISTYANKGYSADAQKVEHILKTIFNPAKFEVEKEHLKGFETTLGNLVEFGTKSFKQYQDLPTANYMKCGSFTKFMQNQIQALGNNKSWSKIFAPMTIALVAITLLAQPFFGNIKKEFPEEGKNGGIK